MTLAVFNLEFRGLPHREATSANPAVAHAVIGIDTLLTQASKVLFGRVVEPEIDVRAGDGTGDFEVDLGFRVDAGKAHCAALAGESFYADPQPDVVLRALGFVAINRTPEELAALPFGWEKVFSSSLWLFVWQLCWCCCWNFATSPLGWSADGELQFVF